MKTSNIICYFLLSVFFCCCKSNKDNNQAIINLKNVELKNIKISSIVDSIYYIKLETSSECLIKDIGQIYLDKDFLFVSDGQEHLFVFNRDGKYLNQIGRKGHGPGEFLAINSFSIDPKNKIVYILDHKRILGYDYQGFYTNIQINTNICIGLSYFNKFFFCSVPYEPPGLSNHYKIIVYDSIGTEINKFLPISSIKSSEWSGFIRYGRFYETNNELLFLDPANNEFYKVDDKNIALKYKFVYGDQMDSENNGENHEFGCGSIIENNNTLLMRYLLDNELHLLYSDKRNNHRVIAKTKDNFAGFENDISNDFPISPDYIFENSWVEILQPYKIIDYLEKFNYKKLDEKLTNLSIDDNPIIRICKLKK